MDTTPIERHYSPELYHKCSSDFIAVLRIRRGKERLDTLVKNETQEIVMKGSKSRNIIYIVSISCLRS